MDDKAGRKARTQEAERFSRIYGKLKAYIAGACGSFGHHFRHIESKDLEQECAIKLLALLRTGKFNDEELELVFKQAIYNLLRDYYRSYRASVQLTSLDGPDPSGTEDGDGNPLKHDIADRSADVFEKVLFKEYSNQIRRALGSELYKQVFDLLVNPDRELVRLAEADHEDALRRKAKGDLVMGAGEVKLRAKHISTRLQVSPATVSRALAEIRQVAQDVLS